MGKDTLICCGCCKPRTGFITWAILKWVVLLLNIIIILDVQDDL